MPRLYSTSMLTCLLPLLALGLILPGNNVCLAPLFCVGWNQELNLGLFSKVPLCSLHGLTAMRSVFMRPLSLRRNLNMWFGTLFKTMPGLLGNIARLVPVFTRLPLENFSWDLMRLGVPTNLSMPELVSPFHGRIIALRWALYVTLVPSIFVGGGFDFSFCRWTLVTWLLLWSFAVN
jgi:hypothetical protein